MANANTLLPFIRVLARFAMSFFTFANNSNFVSFTMDKCLRKKKKDVIHPSLRPKRVK